MNDRITVVIPTYDRPEQLSECLDHLLAADTTGFEDIEILVIDDGSPITAEGVIAAKACERPFRIEYVRQANSGPASARNNGFRRASNGIVLFVDDDVLAPPHLLHGHLAAHREHPNSVIFGLYPYTKPERETPSYRYLDMLERDARYEVSKGSVSGHTRSNIVASGNLSVEKVTFLTRNAVYDETLKTPMAEEIELATRLASAGTPIVYAPELNALHTQPTTIRGKCIQDHKYGLGIAEAYSRLRDKVPPEQFAHTLEVNGPIDKTDPIKLKAAKMLKSFLALRPVRTVFVSAVELIEKLLPNNDRVLFGIYRKLVGVHYFAGIREGLLRFGK